MTQSKSSSTTASRRNSRAAGALLLLALAAAPLSAQDLRLRVAAQGGAVSADLSFLWPRAPDLVASLRRGLECRITFTIRLYEKREAALPFRPDRLVAQATVSRTAFWDFLDGTFVVEEGGGRAVYSGDAALLRGLFTHHHEFAAGPAAPRGLVVVARAHFEPVRLMPPLSIVAIVGAAAGVTTPWVREETP